MRAWLIIAVLCCSLILASCGGSMITEPQDVVFPDSNVSFRGQVLPFLAVTCGVSGCHGDVSAAAGIRLTSYSTLLFDRPNLVVPGKPDESLTIQVLDGRLLHPWGNIQSVVSSSQVRGMRTWILEGAINN
jgi:hypothetical protein